MQNQFYAIGSMYDITTISASVGHIESTVCLSLQRLFESCIMFVCIG